MVTSCSGLSLMAWATSAVEGSRMRPTGSRVAASANQAFRRSARVDMVTPGVRGRRGDSGGNSGGDTVGERQGVAFLC